MAISQGWAVEIPFPPHKMRHTFGTGLLNASSNTWLVQIELGHAKAETSQFYA
jgi:site-specific recombinase XerC